MKSLKQFIAEKAPCWDKYEQYGMKKKNGKEVPNCVPVKEEALQEGRPSQHHPLEGHEYHRKTNAELEYIAKDARRAAEAMKGHDPKAEAKYLDQANDSATVRHFRRMSGTPNWYKKKYGHIKEDWQDVNRKDKTDGLSQKAVDAYRREHPGSKLQTAVTEKNPTGKRASRRKSFCSRMGGMKKRLTNPENARDPDSPINKALRRWKC